MSSPTAIYDDICIGAQRWNGSIRGREDRDECWHRTVESWKIYRRQHSVILPQSHPTRGGGPKYSLSANSRVPRRASDLLCIFVDMGSVLRPWRELRALNPLESIGSDGLNSTVDLMVDLTVDFGFCPAAIVKRRHRIHVRATAFRLLQQFPPRSVTTHHTPSASDTRNGAANLSRVTVSGATRSSPDPMVLPTFQYTPLGRWSLPLPFDPPSSPPPVRSEEEERSANILTQFLLDAHDSCCTLTIRQFDANGNKRLVPELELLQEFVLVLLPMGISYNQVVELWFNPMVTRELAAIGNKRTVESSITIEASAGVITNRNDGAGRSCAWSVISEHGSTLESLLANFGMVSLTTGYPRCGYQIKATDQYYSVLER
ncbi:hypothetical protein FB45DRAFT_866801 [Roridomyces roridus]|uniref:Uncharacterized protein n=1 Tax=Roridomyces roridus TaxID=1738132 RepID=A0AAD7FNP4_9AGAR|nr:hypothetical protein FB45DRAFT_866801 [Roridomyces roridus]